MTSKTYKEFCYRCKCVQPAKRVEHVAGTEWLCCSCGWQVDFYHAYTEHDMCDEPIGSCDNCGTNLYVDDDSELCDQCMFAAEHF